jgi:ketosteroid isomerase-like protein
MDSQQNKQLVMQGYQMYQAGNIDGLLQLFEDDIEWIGMPTESVPFSGTYHGKQGVAQFFVDMDQALEVQEFTPQQFIAEDDKVVVVGKGKWSVKTTGQSYESPWVHVFTVRDGKIALFQQFSDTAATRDAFGARTPRMQRPGEGATTVH